MHDKKYHPVLNHPPLGTGNFGQARLMFETKTGKKVAIKYIPRGKKVRRERGEVIIWHCVVVVLFLIWFLMIRIFPSPSELFVCVMRERDALYLMRSI